MSLVARAQQGLAKLASSPADRFLTVRIDDEHVIGEARPRLEMIANRVYFEVEVNEAWLTIGRRWLKTFDPLVYSVAEFDYGAASQAVPFVVGPQLLRRYGDDVPDEGVLFTDTRVAGPHPLRDRIAVAIVLCAAQRDDYARDLLKVVEAAVGALDFATAVSPYLKLANVVFDGIDALTGAGKMRPVVGLRTELDYRDGLLSPTYFALIATAQLTKGTKLWVREGRLCHGESADSLEAFRDADFVLYSVSGATSRDDLARLPLAPLRDRAFVQAGRATNEELWLQAKASLFALSEEALGSADLIADHADALIEEWGARMRTLKDRAEKMANLGPAGEPDAGAALQARAAKALSL
jgi:hypothetical protein